jgi:hypothetical protein
MRKTNLASWEQLQKDFGEFPPTPLKSTQITTSKFTIKYMNRIGKFLYDVENAFRIFRYGKCPTNDDYVLRLLEEKRYKDIFDSLKDSKTKLLLPWNGLGSFHRFLVAALLIILSPLLVFWSLFILFRMFTSIWGQVY